MGSTEITKRSFTLRYIESLAPKKERYNTPDADVRHLFLVTHPSGRKVFFHLMKAFDPALGKDVPRRTQIGVWGDVTIEQAREHAEKLNSEVSAWKRNGYKGADPLAKPEKAEPSDVPSFEKLVEAYITHHIKEDANNPVRAEYHVRWLLKKHFAVWLDKRLDKVGVDDVLKVKNACGTHRYMANRCVEFARAIFNWSAGKNNDGKLNFWSVTNPAKDVGTFDEDSRERFLQPEEVVHFDEALKDEKHTDLKDFLRLALATGARRSSIFGMRWDDVKWERRVWEVPDSDSKSGESYNVLLLPAALAVLERRREEIPKEEKYVFPGIGKTGHLIDLKKPWTEFRKRAQLSDVRLHDLRRTKFSYEAIAGVSLQIIGKGAGHKSLGSTEIYAKLHDEAVRAAGIQGEVKMLEMARDAKKRIKAGERKKRLKAAERKPRRPLLAAAANG